MISTVSLPAEAVAPGLERRLALAFIVVLFTYVFLANAWLGDDAYITFRVVWNVLHGYGLVFNPGERVQAYTHPLWMMVLAAAHAATREFFFTALVVSYACSLAAVLAVVRRASTIGGGVAVFLWLMSSKAFADYTSSGLENPLSYLLLALFYGRLCDVGEAPLSSRDLRRFGLLAGLAFVNRLDSFVLFALPLLWLARRAWRRRDERAAPLLVAFAIPAAAWVVFATIYYGFPLPNTYYAKVATGIPAPLMYRQGFAYLLNSFGRDPITLGTIGLAASLAFRSSAPVRLAAVSSLLYVGYTISVGGDFMSGRFFAMPFLVSVVALLQTVAGISYHWPVAIVVVYTLLMPLAPVKTTADYDAGWPWRSQNGIKDERGHYHRLTNVFFYSPFRELPDHTWVREGRSFRQSPERVTVQGSIGFYGLEAGPEKHLVDRNALSDPLLARLPVSPRLYFEFYAGHYFRDIPDGYLESLETGRNRIREPLIRDFYNRLLPVLRGPLFTTDRLRSIWYLNVGAGRSFARTYEAHRPIALSVRASNERFGTDVGERLSAAGTLRAGGRAGYLQYGPGIPMRAGTYRARWIGAVEADRSVPRWIGFVDVWDGDRPIARRDVNLADVSGETHQLAQIEFALPEGSRRLDYRFWVNGGLPIVLERVELFSEGR